jgi:hypothetical protein
MMTCMAVIVVPLAVPSTRTGPPVAMALAEAELVPSWYVVADASLTVTFWPAAVVIVKLEVETLSIVPDDPPAAGPDRALDPPPPAPEPLEAVLDGLLPAAAPDVLLLECACAIA